MGSHLVRMTKRSLRGDQGAGKKGGFFFFVGASRDQDKLRGCNADVEEQFSKFLANPRNLNEWGLSF